jgi:superfamily I DNA and RNA helicase
VPVLRRFADVAETCAFVANYARTNPRDQIGVLVADNNAARTAYATALREELPRRTVQTYAWGDDSADRVSDIEFDTPGAILVLNRASCKGLEFDAVFVVDLQSARIDESALDFFRMGMYVMTSRARKALFLAWLGNGRSQPPFLSLMPPSPVLNTL